MGKYLQTICDIPREALRAVSIYKFEKNCLRVSPEKKISTLYQKGHTGQTAENERANTSPFKRGEYLVFILDS